MNIPKDLYYTQDHEWIKVIEGNKAVVGITDFAQKELGDIVYVEIETVGEELNKEETFGTIEAVKTVSDMFMPVSGLVLSVNPKLEDDPESVNKDPDGDGWMIDVELKDENELKDLLSAGYYQKLIDE